MYAIIIISCTRSKIVKHDHINNKTTSKDILFNVSDNIETRGAILTIQYMAFGEMFHLQLKSKQINEISLITGLNNTSSFNVDNVYDGILRNKPNSYFYGTYSNGLLSGELQDVQTLYELSPTRPRYIRVRVLTEGYATSPPEFNRSPKASSRRRSSSRRRRRTTSGYAQDIYKVCSLNVVITDHYYTSLCDRRISKCIGRILWYVHFADTHFRRADFDSDGRPDNIGFVLTNLQILEPDAEIERLDNSESILKKFIRFPMPKFCVNVLFMNKWMADNILGLAYAPKYDSLGERKKPGGMCFPFYHADTRQNSVMVTELTAEGRMARRHVAITLMHELGHSFGALHDDLKRCHRQRGFGNFLMYTSTEDMYGPTVLTFSTCSKVLVRRVLQHQSVCLVEARRYEKCGDYSLGPGEECDSGLDAALSVQYDRCCSVPRGGVASCLVNRGEGYACSARTHACCGYDCQVKRTPALCLEGGECTYASYCDTLSYVCPRALARVDGTPCAGNSRVCRRGKCSGSVCRNVELLDCFCEREFMCNRCCRETVDSLCKPYRPSRVGDSNASYIDLQDSDICDYGNGFCDTNGRCQSMTGNAGDTPSMLKRFEYFLRQYWLRYSLIAMAVLSILLFIHVSIYVHSIS